MIRFKFFTENKSCKSFGDLYNQLIQSQENVDHSIAEALANDPVDEVIEKYMQDCDEDVIQQFRDWRIYRGDWWEEDDVRQALNR